MFSDAQIDALFIEMAWQYYVELSEELTDYIMRSMERMQDNKE